MGAIAGQLSPSATCCHRRSEPARRLGFVYAGDEGGIVCHIAAPENEEALVISLTHVRVSRTLPFATAVLDYQKHRVKRLKKQGDAA
jgi:hypothetical protein